MTDFFQKKYARENIITVSDQQALVTRLAQGPEDLRAAQRLRYKVFVEELGARGPMVDHGARLERDRFDAFADHILLCDPTRPQEDDVVGVYRVMTADMAARAGGFYCATEFDLSGLQASGKPLLELGRSCLHPDYRGGAAMVPLWRALADYVAANGVEIMFGVASFPGIDPVRLAPALSLLHHRHRAPADLGVRAIGAGALPLDALPEAQIDRIAAVKAMPALLKAYLRLGAVVGDGAFVDHAFNTVDVCVILQREAIDALRRSLYAKGQTLG